MNGTIDEILTANPATADNAVSFHRDQRALYAVNQVTGQTRQFSTPDGMLLVNDDDICYEEIEQQCENGIRNARAKLIRYADLGTCDGFKNGFCALSWILYPDGQYFADSDGYGMKDNDEETVYAIINTELEILKPFSPIHDIRYYMKKFREG